MRGLRAACGCLALLMAGVDASRADVQVQRITHRGWKGAYRLANRTVELVFVPQIGRIMRYAYLNGKNRLWENPRTLGRVPDFRKDSKDWINFGGDKVWPAPQARWGWPPDPALDRGAYQVEVLSGNRLRVTGAFSAKHGIRYVREIALDPVGTGVTFKNTMTNTSDQDVEWSVWQVTQVDDPQEMRLPLHRDGKFKRGYYIFKDSAPQPGTFRIVGQEGIFTRHRKRASKIGADSPVGTLSADRDGIRFTVKADYEPGQTYPDDGCAQEIYTNADPDKYIELELLSPIQFVQPGDSYSFTTRWRLTRLNVKRR